MKTMASAISTDVPFLPRNPPVSLHFREDSPDRLYAKRLGPRPPRFAKLLVPWEGLPPLFAGIECTAGRYVDRCAEVWESVRPCRRTFKLARNIELLRKCKA